MAAISNEEINSIMNAANILDVISSYGVNFEKKGNNYFAKCPFHEDNHPSFCVNLEKHIYTCFECHRTGNVFSFVQDYENVSFLEAVRIVADKSGIEVNLGETHVSRYESNYEAVDLASKYYANNLKASIGKKAREYLNKRGLNDDIINEFEIGFASNDSNTLTKLLLTKGFSENVLVDSGLSQRGNSLYDLFRNRVTFPIHDPSGKVVGFSARIYEDVDEAKYINTKETPIFKKGEILFNYHRAVNEARRLGYLILVEGQMDAIRVYASGVKNVVATMGTALTKDHVKLLSHLNVKCVLCFDNDDAGEKATIKNGDILDEAHVEMSVLRLSGAKDPDEYILKFGADKYVDAVKNAISYFDFKLGYLKKNKNFDKVDDVSLYINSVISELNKSKDQVLIDLTVNKLANEYGVDKNVLLNKIVKVEPVKVIKVEEKPKVKLSKYMKLCEVLLYYMINDVKYIKLYEQELAYIPNDKYASVAEDILSFYLKYNYISIADFISYEALLDNYDLVTSIIDNNIDLELSDNEYVGIIQKIKVWINENKISELKEKVKTTSDINEKLKLMDEIAVLKRKGV